MTAEDSRPRELSSWKELAAYLGISVRTAQMWEHERGLPVRRLPGTKGRISVEVSALEAWKNSRTIATPTTADAPDERTTNATAINVTAGDRTNGFGAMHITASPGLDVPSQCNGNGHRVIDGRFTARSQWRRRYSWYAGAASLLFIALLAWPRHGAPCRYRIAQNTLVVLDKQDRVLWEREFPDLEPPTYRTFPLVAFADLDGNGTTSVLFSPVGATTHGTTPVICYTSDGQERWRFTPGRTVRTITDAFEPPYVVHSLIATRLGKEMRIIVTSFHFLYHPTQVALLDRNGRLLGEYWHSGHLDYTIVKNGNILLAGTHNPTGQATLIKLAPGHIVGASTEDNKAFQLLGFPPAREDDRLFFPRSCINLQREPFLLTRGLWLTSDTITLVIDHHPNGPGAGIYYHLNEDLTLRSMGVSNGFENDHHTLHDQGVLNHELSPAEEATLKDITHQHNAR